MKTSPAALFNALRNRGCDIVRVQDIGLQEADDPTILQWATQQQRVIVTEDRQTMPHFAYEQIKQSGTMSGLIVVKNQVPIAAVLEEIALYALVGEGTDLFNLVIYVP